MRSPLYHSYKILFLDVLFPLNLNRVIFVDADQVLYFSNCKSFEQESFVAYCLPSFRILLYLDNWVVKLQTRIKAVTTFHCLLCFGRKSAMLELAALQRLQTRALKIIRNAKIKDTWSCPGMNVENIICFHRNIMTYKIMHKLCPNSFLEKYTPRSSFSSYNTRNSQNLQIPKHRTERYIKSFHYSALSEWNNTPKDLRELPTINAFKRQLKMYMKSKT